MGFKEFYKKIKGPLELFSNLGIIGLIVGLVLIGVSSMLEPSPSLKFRCIYTGTARFNKTGESFEYKSMSFKLYNGGKATARDLGWEITFNPILHLTLDNVTFHPGRGSNCRLVTPSSSSEVSNYIYVKCDFLDPKEGLTARIPLSINPKFYWSSYWSDKIKYQRTEKRWKCKNLSSQSS